MTHNHVLVLPDIEGMELIRIKLNEPRVIEYPNPTKNETRTTRIPKELVGDSRAGIYFMLNGEEIGYVGSTTNLQARMRTHAYLKRNGGVTHVRFLVVSDAKQRVLFESVYKYLLLSEGGKRSSRWRE